MNDLEREGRLLEKIEPTVEAVTADVMARDYEGALLKSMRRLFVLALVTFREAGLHFEQTDGDDWKQQDFALVISAVAKSAQEGLAAFEGTPPDRLIAASGVLVGMDQLLRVLAGAYPA